MVFICENKLLCSCSRSQGFTLLHLPLHLSHCFSFCLLFICFFFLSVAVQDISLTNSAPIALVHIRLVCFWDKEKDRWILSHGSQDSNWGLDGSMPITRQKSSSWVWEMKKKDCSYLLPSLCLGRPQFLCDGWDSLSNRSSGWSCSPLLSVRLWLQCDPNGGKIIVE